MNVNLFICITKFRVHKNQRQFVFEKQFVQCIVTVWCYTGKQYYHKSTINTYDGTKLISGSCLNFLPFPFVYQNRHKLPRKAKQNNQKKQKQKYLKNKNKIKINEKMKINKNKSEIKI